MLLAHNINAEFISVVLFRVGYEVGYKERRQAGWFKRWIAVCEGGAVGAAVGFAVGTAECEGIRLYTGVRTRLATKIVLVMRI